MRTGAGGRNRELEDAVKTLIIRPGALGDTLMLLPSVVALRDLVQIIFAGRSPGRDYLEPHVDRCLDYETSGWHALHAEGVDSGRPLPVPPVDILAAFLTDPEQRVERNLRTLFPQADVRRFPPFPPEDRKIHAALHIAKCLNLAGLPLDPEACIEGALRRPLLRGDAPHETGGSMVLHPGSGSRTKNHPPGFWLDLVARLRDRYPDRENVLLLGPAEESDFSLYSENMKACNTRVVFSPGKGDLTSILTRASLYVGHDSGLSHLAAMLGAPTIALFKDSSVHQWRPLGPIVRVIEGKDGDRELIRSVLQEAATIIRPA